MSEPAVVSGLAPMYAAHRLGLVRLAVLLVDDLALAEDIVQDAFAALHRRQTALRDEAAALGYLRTSVVNGARSALRRRRTVRRFLARSTPTPEPSAPADRDLLAAAERDEVIAALNQLPPRMREVLVLRYWADLTERQVAETLGISEGTVKSTSSRAMDRLHVLLEGRR